MSRGLTEDEAASMIVKGFLSMDIAGLPPELAAETKKMIDQEHSGNVKYIRTSERFYLINPLFFFSEYF